MKRILNTIHEDYHMHSMNYSDGMNTIDEIVQYVEKIWYKKIIITDHSEIEIQKTWKGDLVWRSTTKRRENVHNDIEVWFGVEWDLLDEAWNCCFTIQGKEQDFCILSCHREVFEWDLKNITIAYSNAIKKYHEKIKFMGHICLKKTSKYLDIEKIAKILNNYNIPIEVNAAYLDLWHTDTEKLDHLLSLLETGVYVNSDAHTLADFNRRAYAFDYLKQRGYTDS